MPKICQYKDCEYFTFSRGLCLIHWKQEFGRPPKRTPLKKSAKKIAKTSDKKKILDQEYKRICKEIDAEAKENNRWICFFCGNALGYTCDHHHVAGKEGLSNSGIPLYLDKDGIVPLHRSCHREYHDMTIGELLKSLFYLVLMEKIHYVCKAKYYDMKIKQDEYKKTNMN